MPVISDPHFGYLISAVLILSGLLLYYPFVYRKVEFQFMSKCIVITFNLTLSFLLERITLFLQALFGLEKSEVNIND